MQDKFQFVKQTNPKLSSRKLEVAEIKRMEFRNLLNVQNRDELRQWLLENYNKEPECWVVVKRGRPVDNETFWYIDAVEEAQRKWITELQHKD